MSEDIERMIIDVVEAEDQPEPERPAATEAEQTVLPSNWSQPLFEDNELLGLSAEALTNMRNDRKQLDSLIANLVEMVFNEGDSTTSSKEALVSLMTAKTNMSDKMMSIVELMAKFKLKEIDNAAKKAKTNENYHGVGSRRSFLEQIERQVQKKKKKDK